MKMVTTFRKNEREAPKTRAVWEEDFKSREKVEGKMEKIINCSRSRGGERSFGKWEQHR